MEVHHPHHPTHKKKWSEYIIEFVMLFAAVALGFFAENQREHYVEGHRETQFMESLLEDLDKGLINLRFDLDYFLIKFAYTRLDKKITEVQTEIADKYGLETKPSNR